MNFKLILASAAVGSAAISGANAADLPSAPEPVDYVRVCDAFGSGFYYLPGTETCVRVGGRIRAEFRVRNYGEDAAANSGDGFTTRNQDGTQLRGRGYVRVDSRTNTEFGLLRTFVSLEFTNTTGSSGSSADLDDGFIQFGGLTAGRVSSFFDFTTGTVLGITQARNFSDTDTNLFAYTHSIGNGYSATVSIEDGLVRRSSIQGSFASITIPAVGNAVNFGASQYGGHRLPDLVANFRVDQGWGSAQVMGALHQVWNNRAGVAPTLGLRDNPATPGVVDPIPAVINAGLPANNADSELGWAIGAGVNINLPFIASGDIFVLQGTYAKGATRYATPSFNVDAIIDGNDLELAETWSVGAGIRHNWTKQWESNFTVSYADTEIETSAGDYERNRTTLHSNVVWTPVSGFFIGLETEYSRNDFDIGANSVDYDQLDTSIRLQRTF